MLSTQNPPPDPPPSTSASHISRSRTTTVHLSPPTLTVDHHHLFKSASASASASAPAPHHHHHHHHHLPPNFSIRDYVFSSRTKDIKTNWPFSEKNLQLCLKHGLQDLLPPFQSLDSLRNCSCPATSGGTTLPEQNIIISSSDEHGQLCDHLVVPTSSDGGDDGNDDDDDDGATWNHKIAAAAAEDLGGVKSCRSQGYTNSHTSLEFVSTSITSTSATETATPLSAQVSGGGSPLPPKIDSPTTLPSSTKKCRLIVKYSTIVDPPSSTEDIAPNSTTFSEAMTSIICPVCKTFSSSSNTTLNAHIDQCLSMDSTSNWLPDSKPTTKYRIKPRKMRSMVDICATAPHCTLEELDRRNGTNWATGSASPNLDADQVRAHGKKQRASPLCPEDAAGDEGEVYIDASGTKLRILSKFDGSSSASHVGEDPGIRTALKGGKRSKFFSTNKKKNYAAKQQKYLKLTLPSEKISTPNSRSSQINGCEDGDFGLEEGRDKEEHLTQLLGAQGHIKSSDSGTLRQWVCSKRTGPSKKNKTKDSHQHLGCKLHMAQDLLVENDQSCLGDSHIMESHVQRFPNSLTNAISCEDNQRMGSSSCGTQIDDGRKRSISRKRARRSLVGDQTGDNMERSLEPLTQNSFQLSKSSTSMGSSVLLSPPKCKDHGSFLSSSKKRTISGEPVKISDKYPNASTYPSRDCHAFSSKVIRSSTSRKNVFKQSGPKSNNSSFKKSQIQYRKEMNEGFAASPSGMDEQRDSKHNRTKNQFEGEIIDKRSLGKGIVYGIGHKRGAMSISQKNKTIVGGKMNSFVGSRDDFAGEVDGLESARKEIQAHGEDNVIEQSLETAAWGSIMGSNRYLQPEYEKLDDSSDTRSDSLQCVEGHKAQICETESPVGSTDPCLDGGREMFCADEVSDVVIGQKAHLGAELGSKVTQENDFPEMDPIPIPGPPGSFLPSPRDMGSDGFQGNSSLTTSRMHSSEDRHDLVDRDSSDSPISATSTVSNSTVAISDLNCSEELLSVGTHVVDHKVQYDFSGASSVEPVVENGPTVPQTTNKGADRIISDVKSVKVNVISPKMEPLKFKEINQPCCCSRKEKISPGLTLNFQESQLLRRRAMASVTLPAVGKQMGCKNPNIRSEVFSSSNSSNSGVEKVLLPALNPFAGPAPLKSFSGATVKFPSSGESDSASPSVSTPILRLMGKNLMVVNKEDEDLGHHRDSQPAGSPKNRSKPHLVNLYGVSPGNPQNMDYRSSRHSVVAQDSVNTEHFQYYPNTVEQCIDVRLSNSFRSPTNCVTPQAPTTQALASMFPSKRFCSGRGFESLEPHEYKGEGNFANQMCRRKKRLDAASTYHHIEECENAVYVVNPTKEIIVIDDVPESEAALRNSGDIKYPKAALMGSQVPSGGVSNQGGVDYSSTRHANVYPRHQTRGTYSLGVPVAHESFFHVPPQHLKRADMSPVNWVCTSDGSSVVQRGPNFVSSSSSTSHLRSALYFTPTS